MNIVTELRLSDWQSGSTFECDNFAGKPPDPGLRIINNLKASSVCMTPYPDTIFPHKSSSAS